MIKLESAHIEEVRGIRKLDLDAIEVGLTGEIGRLTGSGTKGLSASEHGPHVDKTKFPDAAFVKGISTWSWQISDDYSKGQVA